MYCPVQTRCPSSVDNTSVLDIFSKENHPIVLSPPRQVRGVRVGTTVHKDGQHLHSPQGSRKKTVATSDILDSNASAARPALTSMCVTRL